MRDPSQAMMRIIVDVPVKAGADVTARIWCAVADAALDAVPDERDGWDVEVYSTHVKSVQEIIDEINQLGRDRA